MAFDSSGHSVVTPRVTVPVSRPVETSTASSRSHSMAAWSRSASVSSSISRRSLSRTVPTPSTSYSRVAARERISRDSRSSA